MAAATSPNNAVVKTRVSSVDRTRSALGELASVSVSPVEVLVEILKRHSVTLELSTLSNLSVKMRPRMPRDSRHRR